MSISVAVITCGPSDLLALLQKSPALTVEVLHPNALTPHCLDGFQCACVLGGTREEPLVFPAECRSVVEDCCAIMGLNQKDLENQGILA